ncbi:hypothetical protein LVJ85_00850 [Neisseria sp. Dent CA1/247]|uniref:hypothetical protein n=1 Tax=Neisseria sp. Dent CA1/247 TaxID=2912675 RepID=UPI001FD6039C|nr:hypothetical protein [Neisseria sp. Dent CA1/247]UOO77102.1 hypothetical protein LVJ85_00850 [Neisseria sp. Dent CA1/247]
MNGQLIVDSFAIDKLVTEMKELISFYEEHFDYKKIRSSKIQKWIDCVGNPNVKNVDKFEYFFQLRQYVRAMQTFKNKSDVIKKDTITKMLSGGQGSKNDRSSDYFFEIDMARRFINREDFEDINLNENTDIIFKSSCCDAEIFVECKNINSDKSFEENIRKANKQLELKLNANKGLGVIAVNLSNVFDVAEYRKLLSPVMDTFIKHYEAIGREEIDILSDRNFQQIFSAMLQGLMELEFRKMFQKFENNDYKFHGRVLGIFYQVEVMIPMRSVDGFFIVRMATYYTFSSNKELENFIFHSLAIGV